MISALRKQYNQEFTSKKYDDFVSELSNTHPSQLDFRVAETPLFIPKWFTEKMLDACEAIIDKITTEEYHQQSQKAIPLAYRVPNEDAHPHFIAFDFGICKSQNGDIEPQLIEMQGFPSLFAYQVLFAETHKKHFFHPEKFSPYLNNLTKEDYIQLLKKIILADAEPEEVILLEIFPEKQKTRIDFHCTETLVGIKTVCLTNLIQEEKNLYYINDGSKIQIKRIYNRLIFDDLFQQPQDVQEKGKIFQQDLNVTWVPHPNWFYKYSKFSLPFIQHPFVPSTKFLNEIEDLPTDLENYVVKPLFSFAGQGVIIDVTKDEINKITDKENWIIQRKVEYVPIIETPGENAKAEIRLFYFWEPGTPRPVAANNLARLSKGKMVGVRYNKDKDWVGGTFCLFEE
jgi:hypothetical protein